MIKMSEEYIIPQGSVLYHGTVWDIRTGELFLDLDPQKSDFKVIWFSYDEGVAEDFSTYAIADEPERYIMQVVMSVRILRDLLLFNIDRGKFEWEGRLLDITAFLNTTGIGPREIYKYIDHKKYYGAVQRASSGMPGGGYLDIALFFVDKIKIVGYKFWSHKSEEWSRYLTREGISAIYKEAHRKYLLSQ
jgi:hypothetical protein